ncbi:MAG: nucleotidyltransferase domain-containing protein [Myxococcota bacterium]
MSSPVPIFETVHGSRAYGLARLGSDTDRKGVVVGPTRWYLGVRPGPEQVELSPDHVRYDVRKFLRLLGNANPTVLETLFTAPEHHEIVTTAGERLLAERERFLTRRVGQTFAGYALGQLQRIRRHRRWLRDPPETPPTRAAFGLPERTLVPKDQRGAAETLIARAEERGEPPPAYEASFLEVLAREKRYAAAKKEHAQFQRWKRERNPARAALEAAHGYDTKHAMHLVRLQRMAREILAGEGVRVTRDDRAELLAIRDGAWSYDALVAHAEAESAAIREAERTSALPGAVDEDLLDALAETLITMTWETQR